MPSSFGCGFSHRFSTVDNIEFLHFWLLFADAVTVYVLNGVEAFLLPIGSLIGSALFRHAVFPPALVDIRHRPWLETIQPLLCFFHGQHMANDLVGDLIKLS